MPEPGARKRLLGGLAVEEKNLLEILLATGALPPARTRDLLKEKAASPSRPLALILLDGYVSGETLDLLLARALSAVRENVEAGSAFLAAGSPSQAAAHYSRALSLKPQDAEAHLSRAVAYALLGQIELALADASRAIELVPKNAAAHNIRGMLHARLGRAGPALADLTRAIEIDPRANYLFDRGLVHQTAGDHAAAILDFSRAIELGFSRPECWYRRGISRLHREEVDGAACDLLHFLGIASAHAALRKNALLVLAGLLKRAGLSPDVASRVRAGLGALGTPPLGQSLRPRAITAGTTRREGRPKRWLVPAAASLVAIAGLFLALPGGSGDPPPGHDSPIAEKKQPARAEAAPELDLDEAAGVLCTLAASGEISFDDTSAFSAVADYDLLVAEGVLTPEEARIHKRIDEAFAAGPKDGNPSFKGIKEGEER